MKISADPESELVTYSLGSCLGIAIYDPVVRVGGMVHCMLPLGNVDNGKAKTKPFMFVDIGLVMFLRQLFELGVTKSSAVVKVCGGATVLDNMNLFRIGERNYIIFRKLMWKNGMMIAAEDVGGKVTRTMRMEIATGRVFVRTASRTSEL